jgi:hypothetical protein
MGRADLILAKTKSALNKVGPSDRQVYKRVVTRTGGDSLIGRGGTITHVDTLLDPQPLYQRLGRNIVGDSAPSQELLNNGSNRIADDYQVTFHPDAVSQADLNNKDLLFVFRDASNRDEIFRVTDFEPVAINGKAVMFVGYLRSTARP